MKKQVQPTLFIGLGGTGVMAISDIKKLMNQAHLDPRYEFPLVRFLAIDTEFITQPAASNIRSHFVEQQLRGGDNSYETSYEVGLEKHELFPIEVHISAMKDYLKHPHKIGAADFVNADKMERVVKAVAGNGAGGYGIVGKMAIWQYLTSVKERLTTELNLLNNMEYIREKLHHYKDHFELSSQHQLNIFVLCSLGGGTGKGTFLTIGVMIRELLLKMGTTLSDGAEIILVNYTPSCFRVSGRKVSTGYFKTIQANQYASLKELEFVLKYGYPLEKRLKEELNIPDQERSEKIYTNILQVAAQLDTNGIYLGDYATINQSVASILTSYVFGNVVAEFRAYFRSNKGAFIGDNPVFENNGLQQERVRDYGRIGCYRLSLPIVQLFQYSQAWYAAELLEDLYQGKHNPLPIQEQILPAAKAGTLIENSLNQYKQLLQIQPFVNFQHLSQICSTFDHPWLANIQEGIRGSFNSLSMQFVAGATARSAIEHKIAQFVNCQVNGLESEKGGWKAQFGQYCFNYGIVATKSIIENMLAVFEAAGTKQFSTLLRLCSNHPYYQQHFVFGQNDQALLQLLLEQQQQLEEELRTYCNGAASAFYATDIALQNDRKDWQKRNNSIWKKIFGQEEKALQQSKGAIQQLLLTARQIFEKYVGVCRFRVQLEVWMRLQQELQTIYHHLDANQATIIQADSNSEQLTGGLLKAYQDRKNTLANQSGNSLEIRIAGDKEQEFIDFAQQLKFDKEVPILATLHNQLENLNHQLVQTIVAPEALIAQLDTVTQAILALQKNQTLTAFLQHKIGAGKEKEVKRYLQQLHQNAAFLGKLNTATAEGGLDRAGFTRSIVQTESPKLIHQTFPDLFDANTKVVASEHKENITLTKLETGLPLFLFQEFMDAQRVYFQVCEEERGQQEKHTHQHFVDFPEPFGTTTEMNRANLQLFVLVLLHLGIIRILNGVIHYSVHPHDAAANWQPLVNEQKSPFLFLAQERQVSLEELMTSINHHKKWFDLLGQLALKLVESVFMLQHQKARREAITYLSAYFRLEVQGGKGFPPFPPVLLQYILEQTKLPMVSHQLQEWKWFNQRKFKEWQQSPFFKMEQLPNTIEKMTPWFRKPDFTQLKPTPIIKLPLKVKQSEKNGKTLKKATPENPFTKSMHKKRYRVATPDKVFADKMGIDQIIALIKKQEYVVISEHGDKHTNDWKEWRDVPAIAKAMRKAG